MNSTVWMHHMDADQANRERAIQEIHKNATSCIEQILEAASQPLISKTTQLRRTAHARHCWGS